MGAPLPNFLPPMIFYRKAYLIGSLTLVWLAAASCLSAAKTIRYQQGSAVEIVGGGSGAIYTGQTDAEMNSTQPDTNFDIGTTAGKLTVDFEDDPAGEIQALMHFADIVGPGHFQVPAGSVIDAASLDIQISDPGIVLIVIRIAESVVWSADTVTWNNFGASGGGVDFGAGGDTAGNGLDIDYPPVGELSLDVTEMVQAWVDGAANRGIAFTTYRQDPIAFSASDSSVFSIRPVLTITYSNVNPNVVQFTQDPIESGIVFEGENYSFDLAPYASDPDDDALSFELVEGPSWLQISPSGLLSGMPQPGDAGYPSIIVRVSDTDDGSDTVQVRLRVLDEVLEGDALTTQVRLVWVNDPATTVTVAWSHITGNDAQVHYGTEDFGRAADLYPSVKFVDRSASYSGNGTIVSKFARLSGLQPDTAYYFVLSDEAGVSARYWFRTAPDSPKPFSFIVGGDSRNNREPRQKANRMVAKLRPLFVAFTGDMIDDDDADEWNEWLDDWELTISEDGRIYPLLPHRGNHESRGNTTIYDLFDTTVDNYYAITIGGDLFRYYVLNSESGEYTQRNWIQSDLDALGGVDAFTHLAAGYHKPMRPHHAAKTEGSIEYDAWSYTFHDYRFDVVFESDSHAMKRTKPIKPSTGAGSEEGFIEDVAEGTVYTGEGCWGAPLRDADDSKSWTVDAGRFNGFDLVHVYESHIELFTVQVDGEANSEALPQDGAALSLPPGIPLWDANGGKRLVIERSGQAPLSFGQYQLENFFSTGLPANSGIFQDFDGDGVRNGEEFIFVLNPNGVDSLAARSSQLPHLTKDANGDMKYAFRRRTNLAGDCAIWSTQDLAFWTELEEGVDYELQLTPGTGYEDVEIALIGTAAEAETTFFRVVYGQ